MEPHHTSGNCQAALATYIKKSSRRPPYLQRNLRQVLEPERRPKVNNSVTLPNPAISVDDMLLLPRLPTRKDIVVYVRSILDFQPLDEQKRQSWQHISPLDFYCTLRIYEATQRYPPTSDQVDGRYRRTRIAYTGTKQGWVKHYISRASRNLLQLRLEEPFVIEAKTLSEDGSDLVDQYIVEIILTLDEASTHFMKLMGCEDILGAPPNAEMGQLVYRGVLFNQEWPQDLPLALATGSFQGRITPFANSLDVDIRFSLPVRLRLPQKPILKIDIKRVNDEDVTLVYTQCVVDRIGISSQKQVDCVGRGFLCALCRLKHPSWGVLRHHFKVIHGEQYRFTTTSLEDDCHYLVEFSESNPAIVQEHIDEETADIQLGPPKRRFILGDFLDDDLNRYVEERRGPFDGSRPRSGTRRSEPVSKCTSSSVSPIKAPSRPSPITSFELDSSPPQWKESRVLRVPKTDVRLFHSKSRKVLVPGDILPNDEDEIDNSWRIARHKQVLLDFTDLSEDETDYIIHWDTFLETKSRLERGGIRASFRQFVEENEHWFMQRGSRTAELLRHLAAHRARGQGTLDIATFNDVCDIIKIYRERADRLPNEIKEVIETVYEGTTWPPLGIRLPDMCVCLRFVYPEDCVICCEVTCKNRYYHHGCLPEKETRSVKHYGPRKFRCVDCTVTFAASSGTAPTPTLFTAAARPQVMTPSLSKDIASTIHKDHGKVLDFTQPENIRVPTLLKLSLLSNESQLRFKKPAVPDMSMKLGPSNLGPLNTLAASMNGYGGLFSRAGRDPQRELKGAKDAKGAGALINNIDVLIERTDNRFASSRIALSEEMQGPLEKSHIPDGVLELGNANSDDIIVDPLSRAKTTGPRSSLGALPNHNHTSPSVLPFYTPSPAPASTSTSPGQKSHIFSTRESGSRSSLLTRDPPQRVPTDARKPGPRVSTGDSAANSSIIQHKATPLLSTSRQLFIETSSSLRIPRKGTGSTTNSLVAPSTSKTVPTIGKQTHLRSSNPQQIFMTETKNTLMDNALGPYKSPYAVNKPSSAAKKSVTRSPNSREALVVQQKNSTVQSPPQIPQRRGSLSALDSDALSRRGMTPPASGPSRGVIPATNSFSTIWCNTDPLAQLLDQDRLPKRTASSPSSKHSTDLAAGKSALLGTSQAPISVALMSRTKRGELACVNRASPPLTGTKVGTTSVVSIDLTNRVEIIDLCSESEPEEITIDLTAEEEEPRHIPAQRKFHQAKTGKSSTASYNTKEMRASTGFASVNSDGPSRNSSSVKKISP